MACTVDFFADCRRSLLVLIKEAKEAVGSATIAEYLVESLHQFVVAFNDGAVRVN